MFAVVVTSCKMITSHGSHVGVLYGCKSRMNTVDGTSGPFSTVSCEIFFLGFIQGQ